MFKYHVAILTFFKAKLDLFYKRPVQLFVCITTFQQKLKLQLSLCNCVYLQFKKSKIPGQECLNKYRVEILTSSKIESVCKYPENSVHY